MPPPLIGGGIKRCFCLMSVCLSVAYIGPNSRTERPRKTKIGIEVGHVTCDSDTTFKVKRSKVKVTRPLYSARPQRVRQVQRWPRENVLGVGNYCYVGSSRRRARRWGAHGGGEGWGHIVSSRAQLVSYKYRSVKKKTVSKLEETTAVSQCELYTATDRGVRAASVESRPSSDRFRSISDNIFSSRHHTPTCNKCRILNRIFSNTNVSGYWWARYNYILHCTR